MVKYLFHHENLTQDYKLHQTQYKREQFKYVSNCDSHWRSSSAFVQSEKYSLREKTVRERSTFERLKVQYMNNENIYVISN